ncbi:MAG: 5'/3'-nucleotidase SurE [Actinomycetota bacterium]|nr:5'/3'-nucleotidase SurE [Actinomycetota bacterium]
MRALVTNDDGVRSPGLTVLAEAARRRGLDVTAVAPSYDARGSSAAMTAVTEDGQVTVVARTDSGGAPVMGVQGPPAFIVRAAMYGAFGPPPDLVLSGVNRGQNTGRAVLHSGTVGAALTAANHGRRALALSAAVDEHDLWLPEDATVDLIIEWLEQTPAGTVLNVNLPGRSGRAGTGTGPLAAMATTLAEAGIVQGRVSDSGGSMSVVFEDGERPAGPGTDVAALDAGLVSVTAIRSVVEDDRVDTGRLLGARSRPKRRS